MDDRSVAAAFLASTLRAAGSKSDPYEVFEKMLNRGHPPDGWAALLAASRGDWGETS